MRVFVDTNVIVEAMLKRPSADLAQRALAKIESEKFTAYISTQSFCTMTYLLEHGLKKVGIQNPKRLEQLRSMMNTMLDCFKISELSSKDLRKAVNSNSFRDIEDACQYQAAENAKCDVLITFNISDFKDAKGSVMVMSPEEFICSKKGNR